MPLVFNVLIRAAKRFTCLSSWLQASVLMLVARAMLAHSVQAESGPPTVTFGTGENPFVRVVSGLLVYEESLIAGTWRTRYWSPRGMVKPGYTLAGSEMAARFGPEGPTAGEPWAGSFSLVADDQELVTSWQFVSAREVVESSPASNVAVVELKHDRLPLSVRLHTRVSGHPFLERWLTIKNTGTRPLALGAVSPMAGFLSLATQSGTLLPKGTAAFSLLRAFDLGNNHREMNLKWVDLPRETVYSYGGAKHGHPFALVRCATTNEWFVVHFGYSGSYTFDFAHRRESSYMGRDVGSLAFRVNLGGLSPKRALLAGEECVTPSVYVGHLTGSFDDVVQASHAYLRESVLPPLPANTVRPVEFNHFGYVLDQVTEKNLFGRIDVAAAIGAELFTVDAGWFSPPGVPWNTARGDWEANRERFPNGLEAVFARARSRGLKCGLWFDIETADEGSQLLKAHPDWTIRDVSSDSRLNLAPRRNWILDATLPEARAHMEETLTRLIRRYKLDVFRLDYNAVYDPMGSLLTRRGMVENYFWRHYDEVYALYNRLRRKFPAMLMENCASGGGRNDLGMLKNFHYATTSDESTSVDALKIANSFSVIFPPEWGMNFFGSVLPDTHRYGDLDFQLRAVMFNALGISGVAPSVAEMPAELLSRVKHHVALYKEFIRPIMPTARVYHHTPVVPQDEVGDWVAMEHAAPDKSRAYAGVFRLRAAPNDEYRLRFRGIAPEKTYLVAFDSAGLAVKMSGLALRQEGLLIRLAEPLTSELVTVIAQ